DPVGAMDLVGPDRQPVVAIGRILTAAALDLSDPVEDLLGRAGAEFSRADVFGGGGEPQQEQPEQAREQEARPQERAADPEPPQVQRTAPPRPGADPQE